MNLNIKHFQNFTIVTLLFGIGVSSLNAQVMPSKNVTKILKSIYDNPLPDKFTLGAYEFDGYGKKIVIFGSNHGIRNPSDSMFMNMENEFSRLSPDIVFTEAISSYLHPTKEQNIQLGGDMAFPRYLAHKNGIAAHIWDLDQGEIYNLLRKEFSREDLYLFFQCVKLQALDASINSQINSVIIDKARELSFMGIPVSEREWTPDYFKALFKRKFHIEYESGFTQENWDELEHKFTDGQLAKIKSKFFQLRDLRLLTTIGSFVETNDRIFIQAGAMHKQVMKQVLPLYMESVAKYAPRQPNKPIKILSVDSLEKPYHIKLKIRNKEIILWAAGTSDTSQIKNMSQSLLEFKPSAILIEDYPEHYATIENNLKYAGDAGVIRYIGAQNDLPVYNWASQVNHSLQLLSKKYKREDVCSAVTFYYLMKYEQVFKNFKNYNDFWNAISARLLCSNTMFSHYEASIGRFSEYALGYGFLSETESHEVKLDFEKLRMVLRQPSLGSINEELELLKANELLNSIRKQLQTNDRIFVHAPFRLIKSIEKSISGLY